MSQINVDTIKNREGSGGIALPNSAVVTGVLTATSFKGDITGNVTGNATGLTGTPSIVIQDLVGVGATFSGALTYEDVTQIDSVGIVTARSGIKVLAGGINAVGVITATSYEGSGANLTGIEAGISTEVNTVSGGYVEIDLAKDDHKFEATGFTTVTTKGNSPGTEGGSGTIRITNSGICTVGFSTYFLWPSGAAPFVPIADGTVSLISYTIQRNGSVGIGTQLLAGASVNFS